MCSIKCPTSCSCACNGVQAVTGESRTLNNNTEGSIRWTYNAYTGSSIREMEVLCLVCNHALKGA